MSSGNRLALSLVTASRIFDRQRVQFRLQFLELLGGELCPRLEGAQRGHLRAGKRESARQERVKAANADEFPQLPPRSFAKMPEGPESLAADGLRDPVS